MQSAKLANLSLSVINFPSHIFRVAEPQKYWYVFMGQVWEIISTVDLMDVWHVLVMQFIFFKHILLPKRNPILPNSATATFKCKNALSSQIIVGPEEK